jgi:hypothetical protein
MMMGYIQKCHYVPVVLLAALNYGLIFFKVLADFAAVMSYLLLHKILP